jgi:cyclophilin family peptidyl-prolyl cis-trans isomerase
MNKFLVGAIFLSTLSAQSVVPVVRLHTNLGDIDVQLLPNSAPNTVANFLAYMNAGFYNNSIIHRSVPGFVWQGGGYQLIDNNLVAIPANAAINNEFNVSNTYGTLAMALEGTNINSATTEWFFNETDNSSTLDSQLFTVFGRISSSDTASMTVLNNIATVPVFSTAPLGSVFDQIPLLNYNGGAVMDSNYVLVQSIEPAPFGSFDTPINNTTGIAGAIGVTGWALSDVGVSSVAIWRDPVGREVLSGDGLVFIGTANIVPGTRPDVAQAYPGYPNNSSGWGYLMLTNELPSTAGQGVGNGTYNLHVLVTDNSDQTVDLGVRTITVDNASSVLPFGSIDTPTQGGTASGTAFVNFGWAVTPQPNMIPLDGSTIWVVIYNVRMGHPVYNNYRVDIATLFPGLQNSMGAVGYYYIDTTQLTNGLHTISWVATDSAGNAAGLGSRYFNVQN